MRKSTALKIVSSVALCALLGACVARSARAGDWPAFRGPEGNGVAVNETAPLRWGPSENIVWKTPMPGKGNSSPIVSRGRVFVTAANDEGKKRGLHCFNRADGKLLWSKVVEYAQPDPTHRTNPYCGSSPAADGQRVVVWHGSAGLHCYDYNGKELWTRDLGVFRHIWGYGSSPVFHDGRIFLNCGPGERTFVAAIDPRDGRTIWQQDEPGGTSGETPNDATNWNGSWSTPVVARVADSAQILVSLPQHVRAYDPADGKILWTCEGLGKLAYTSPLVGHGIVVAMGGYHGPAMGFKLGGSGDVTAANRIWHTTSKIPQRIGSGVIFGKHVYMANEQQLAQCLELETGKVVWESRMPQGVIWASLILVEDRLYVTNQQGTTVVFRANPEKFELLAENVLDEPSNSTLAVSQGQVFLQTTGHLYCIGEPSAK